MPTISAVIPIYNRETTIGRALQSIANQTLAVDEIIVVDDASTDNSAEVALAHGPIKLIRLKKNAGAANARNEGSVNAKNDWIAFLDSDDEWLPEKLATQCEYLAEHPDLDLICCGVRLQQRDGKVREVQRLEPTPANGWRANLLDTHPFSTPCWLVRKQALMDVGLFDCKLPNHEDLELLLRLTEAGKKIAVVPHILLNKFNQADGIDTDPTKMEVSLPILIDRYQPLWDKAPGAAARKYMILANEYARQDNMVACRRAIDLARQQDRKRLKYQALKVAARLGRSSYFRARRLRQLVRL